MPDHDERSSATPSPLSSSPLPPSGPWGAVRAFGIIGLTFLGAKFGVVPTESVPLVLLGVAMPSDWIANALSKIAHGGRR